MPLHDFSKGYPRNGQWVLVDGARVGIFVIESKTKAVRTIGDAKPPKDPARAKIWNERQEARRVGDYEAADAARTKLLASGGDHPDAPIVTVVAAEKKLVLARELPHGRQKGLVHFVDKDGGYAQQELVEFDRITPVLDRRFIPAKRLSTMSKDFVPTA